MIWPLATKEITAIGVHRGMDKHWGAGSRRGAGNRRGAGSIPRARICLFAAHIDLRARGPFIDRPKPGHLRLPVIPVPPIAKDRMPVPYGRHSMRAKVRRDRFPVTRPGDANDGRASANMLEVRIRAPPVPLLMRSRVWRRHGAETGRCLTRHAGPRVSTGRSEWSAPPIS